MKRHFDTTIYQIVSLVLLTISINCAASNWMEYGNYDISWYSTDQKEYSLKNAQQIAGLAYLVNHNISDFEGCSFRLENDINLNGKDWIPIGSKENSFKGIIDGNGVKISGIYISRYDSDFIGFFGNIHKSTLKNFYIDGTIRQRDKASIRCGLVSGKSTQSTIENLNVNLKLYLDKIEPHEYNGDSYWNWYHGGVVGDSEYSDYNSISSNVTIQDNIGSTQNRQTDIDRSIYLGGIIGRMKGGSVNKCMANNNYESSLYFLTSHGLSTKVIFGGIIGLIENSKSSDSKPYKIISCFAENNAYGHYNVAYYQGYFYSSSCKFKLGGIIGTTCDDTDTNFLHKATQIECCVAINKGFEIDGAESMYITTYAILGGILGSESKYQPAIFSSNYSNSDCKTVYKDVRYKQSGLDGYNTYTRNQMQNQAFIDEINELNYLKFNERPWELNAYNTISLKGIGPRKSNVAIEKITIEPDKHELYIGESKEFLAKIYPENATDKSVDWKSKDTKIAIVNSDGKVTAVSGGTTTITCTAKDGSGAMGSCSVTVIESVQDGDIAEVNSLRYRIHPADNSAVVVRQTQDLSGIISIPERISYKGNNYTVTEIGDSAFWNKRKPTGITISSTIKKIGNYAFYQAESLTSIEIPDNVESIGKEPFDFCSALESVYIGKGLKSLDIYPFWCCPRLSSIKVSDQNQYYASEGNILYSKDHKIVYKVPETMSEVTLSDSVEIIRNGCFGDNDLIEHIDLPDGLMHIYASAFMYCDNLKSIAIPDNVTDILNSAFEECESLKSIEIGEKVEIIGPSVFATGSNYSKVLIRAIVPPTIEESTFDNYAATLYVPVGSKSAYTNADYWKNFQKIEESDFSSGEANKEFTYEGINYVILDGVESYTNIIASNVVDGLRFAMVADGNVAQPVGENRAYGYLNANEIKEDAVGIQLPENLSNCNFTIESTPDGDYYIKDSLGRYVYLQGNYNSFNVSYDLPEEGAVWRITFRYGDYRAIIHNKTAGKYIQYDPRYQSYGAYSDERGTLPKLYVPLPDAVRSTSKNRFCMTKPGEAWTSSGTKVSEALRIPETASDGVEDFTVVAIGDWSFAYEEITSITLPNTILSIGHGAFFMCHNISEIELPKSLINLGDYGLFCEIMSSVFIPSSVMSIGDEACSGPNITKITVDEDNPLYLSQEGVLYNRDGKILIRVPRGLNGDFNIPNTVNILDRSAFYFCSFSSITIPSSITAIHNYAFDSAYFKELYYDTLDPITAEKDVFSWNDYKNATLYVPAEAMEKIKVTEPWKNFEKIEAYDFHEYASLNSIGEAIEKARLLEINEYSEPYVIDFEPVVSYATGAYNYIVDDGKYFNIYKENLGLVAGQTINRGWTGRLHNYYGLLELEPMDDTEIFGGEFVGIPEPVRVENAIEINKDLLSAVVYIPDVIFNESTPEGRTSFTGKLGNQYLIFYNNFSLPTHPAGQYDVLATVSIYYDQLEIQPIEFINTNSVEEIYSDGLEEYYNLQGQQVTHPQKSGIYIRKTGQRFEKVYISR